MEGYRRNADKICVPEEECPEWRPIRPEPRCRKPNERWNECTTSCSERTCANLKPSDNACAQVCNAKCDCVKGYRRDANLDCVPEQECSKSDGTLGGC